MKSKRCVTYINAVEAPALNGKRPVGRPSIRNSENEEAILRRISEGESLNSICRGEAMPDYSTVCRWLADDQEFRDKYALAREAQAEVLAEQLLDIADDASDDFAECNGKLVFNKEAVMRSRLRVDTRKWIAAKLLPKKYGDRPETNVNVSTIVHNHIPVERQKQLQARREKVLGR